MILLSLQHVQAAIWADTQVATINNSQISVQMLGNGSKVLTRAGLQTVVFSATKGETYNGTPVIGIKCGNGSILWMSYNQPVLTTRGTFKLASKLIPGQDDLVSASGEAVEILQMSASVQRIRLSLISAASYQPASTTNDHTILANGIWVGDYSMELACSLSVGRAFCE